MYSSIFRFTGLSPSLPEELLRAIPSYKSYWGTAPVDGVGRIYVAWKAEPSIEDHEKLVSALEDVGCEFISDVIPEAATKYDGPYSLA